MIWFSHAMQMKSIYLRTTFGVNAGGYVITHIDGSSHKFHNMAMNHRPGLVTVDHIDRNPLNCHKSNLRRVNKQTQNINHSIISRFLRSLTSFFALAS